MASIRSLFDFTCLSSIVWTKFVVPRDLTQQAQANNNTIDPTFRFRNDSLTKQIASVFPYGQRAETNSNVQRETIGISFIPSPGDASPKQIATAPKAKQKSNENGDSVDGFYVVPNVTGANGNSARYKTNSNTGGINSQRRSTPKTKPKPNQISARSKPQTKNQKYHIYGRCRRFVVRQLVL